MKALLYHLGQSISFGRLSLPAKVLWPMLLAACDHQGRGLAAPEVVKWRVCPNVDELTRERIKCALGEMEQQNMIHIYGDGAYYQVVHWWDYQRHQWARPSRYPAPAGWTDRVRTQNGRNYITHNWDQPGGFSPDAPQDCNPDAPQDCNPDAPQDCNPDATPDCQEVPAPADRPTRHDTVGRPDVELQPGDSRVDPTGRPVGQRPGCQARRPPTGQPGKPAGRPPDHLASLPPGQPPGKSRCQPPDQPLGQPAGQRPGCQAGRPPGNPPGRPPGQPPDNPPGRPPGKPATQPPDNPPGLPPTGQPGNPPGRPPGQATKLKSTQLSPIQTNSTKSKSAAPIGAGREPPTPPALKSRDTAAPPADKKPPDATGCVPRPEPEAAAAWGAPPAVRAFRRVTHRYPAISWYNDIDRTVGRGDEDLQFWERIVKTWVGRGWNPRNISGMLECYRRRELPGQGRPRRGGPPTSALADYRAWLAEEQEE